MNGSTQQGNQMARLIRSALVLALFLLVLIVGAYHGIRGLAVAGVFILVWAAKDTRAFKSGEALAIRVTGSRSRAAIGVLTILMVAIVAVDFYESMH